jgi:23S rRNA pseudouridine2605 synthase
MTRPAISLAGESNRRVSLARALSKFGYCSRTQAVALIEDGAITVDGRPCIDPNHRLDPARVELRVRGKPIAPKKFLYIMLNKPRGLVTTRADEQGRETVYSCFATASLPFIAPVGRLDKASEGLLLFTNDTQWANAISAPESHVEKVYHVQIAAVPEQALMGKLESGVILDGERLSVKRASILRSGARNSWIEITLDEGKTRHIRRLLGSFDITVLRLIRVAVGNVALGNLAKGQWRALDLEERQGLART